MKKAFTLIELVLVIFIIGLMAVLAIPAFDKYGARTELDAKAQEMKVAIESAYMQAKNPAGPYNGVDMVLKSSPDNRIEFSDVNIPKDGTYCVGTGAAACTVVLDDTKKVMFDNNISLLSCQVDGTAGTIEIMAKSPAGKEDTYMNGSNAKTAVSCTITSRKLGESKNITINRYPFSVIVE